jgi:TatD DNase family protein
MPYFDTHAHLNDEQFDSDRDEVLLRAANSAIAGMLCVGTSASSSETAVNLAESHPAVFAAVGIHPNSASEAGPDDWQRVVDLSAHPRIVALGETGLDRYRDYSPFPLQQEYLDRHLCLAQERGLPVIVHCRDAAAELLPMLRAAAARGLLRGVIHAFSDNAAMAAECVALGLFISFAGNVTYSNKKFDVLRAAAKTVPDDRLLIETDSPYLVPQVLRGRQDRNEPGNVVHTAAFLAELRTVSVDEIALLTTANARRLFQLDRWALPESV